MRLQIDRLGKVAITVEQGYWDITKDYDKLTVVEKEGIFGTYISRKPVPAGTELTNREYWIPFSSLKEEIVLAYNTFVDKYGSIIDGHTISIEDILLRLGTAENDINNFDIKLLTTLTEVRNEVNKVLQNIQNSVDASNNATNKANEAIETANEINTKTNKLVKDFETTKNELKQTVEEIKSGYAPIENGTIPSQYLPSYVDDVLEFDTKEEFPEEGESGKIYVAIDTNIPYRWSGTVYTEIGSSLALGETSSTAYPGNKGKELADKVKNLEDNPYELPVASPDILGGIKTNDFSKVYYLDSSESEFLINAASNREYGNNYSGPGMYIYNSRALNFSLGVDKNNKLKISGNIITATEDVNNLDSRAFNLATERNLYNLKEYIDAVSYIPLSSYTTPGLIKVNDGRSGYINVSTDLTTTDNIGITKANNNESYDGRYLRINVDLKTSNQDTPREGAYNLATEGLVYDVQETLTTNLKDISASNAFNAIANVVFKDEVLTFDKDNKSINFNLENALDSNIQGNVNILYPNGTEGIHFPEGWIVNAEDVKDTLELYGTTVGTIIDPDNIEGDTFATLYYDKNNVYPSYLKLEVAETIDALNKRALAGTYLVEQVKFDLDQEISYINSSIETLEEQVRDISTGSYELPVATYDTLGGVKVGDSDPIVLNDAGKLTIRTFSLNNITTYTTAIPNRGTTSTNPFDSLKVDTIGGSGGGYLGLKGNISLSEQTNPRANTYNLATEGLVYNVQKDLEAKIAESSGEVPIVYLGAADTLTSEQIENNKAIGAKINEIDTVKVYNPTTSNSVFCHIGTITENIVSLIGVNTGGTTYLSYDLDTTSGILTALMAKPYYTLPSAGYNVLGGLKTTSSNPSFNQFSNSSTVLNPNESPISFKYDIKDGNLSILGYCRTYDGSRELVDTANNLVTEKGLSVVKAELEDKISSSGGSYTLPVASSSALGGFRTLPNGGTYSDTTVVQHGIQNDSRGVAFTHVQVPDLNTSQEAIGSATTTAKYSHPVSLALKTANIDGYKNVLALNVDNFRVSNQTDPRPDVYNLATEGLVYNVNKDLTDKITAINANLECLPKGNSEYCRVAPIYTITSGGATEETDGVITYDWLSNVANKFGGLPVLTKDSYENPIIRNSQIPVRGDDISIISAVEDGYITMHVNPDAGFAYVAHLEVGNTEEVKTMNKEHIPADGEPFFVCIDYGIGVGRFIPGSGGNMTITTAEGYRVHYKINSDYSIVKDTENYDHSELFYYLGDFTFTKEMDAIQKIGITDPNDIKRFERAANVIIGVSIEGQDEIVEVNCPQSIVGSSRKVFTSPDIHLGNEDNWNYLRITTERSESGINVSIETT